MREAQSQNEDRRIIVLGKALVTDHGQHVDDLHSVALDRGNRIGGVFLGELFLAHVIRSAFASEDKESPQATERTDNEGDSSCVVPRLLTLTTRNEILL